MNMTFWTGNTGSEGNEEDVIIVAVISWSILLTLITVKKLITYYCKKLVIFSLIPYSAVIILFIPCLDVSLSNCIRQNYWGGTPG